MRTPPEKDAAIADTAQRLIYDAEKPQLREWLFAADHPAFRTNQIWRWLYSSAVERWEQMTNLPADLRQALADGWLLHAVALRKQKTSRDGTTKLLLELQDQEQIESVLIRSGRRRTVCVSTQAGCRFGCAFCASGLHGLRRNLTPGEIVEQVVLASRLAKERISHVVLMGMGEPLDNYDATLAAIRRLNDRDTLDIGARRITISTCGLVPGIRRFTQEGLQVELSVSLHAPTDSLRNQLMPVNRKYPLRELLESCREHTRVSGRIITFEYTLVQDLNAAEQQARQLLRLLDFPCRVNLIPLSPVELFPGRAPHPADVQHFARILQVGGLPTTIRRSAGGTIQGACGQLRLHSHGHDSHA